MSLVPAAIAMALADTPIPGPADLAAGAVLLGALMVPGDTPVENSKKSAEERALNREKNRVCKSPDIKTGDPCIDAKSRLSRLQRCLTLRESYRDRFGDRHPTEISNAKRAVEKAKQDVRNACGEEPNCP